MMPAAKHFDPVLGIDIHIIQPPGPVPPIPVPHPFIGFLFDAMEYIPISIPVPIPFVGVVPIPLNASIKINGMLRAIAGTMGKTVPGVHFPIGGTFVKPPANECEMFMGSSTVEFDGDAASYMALPTLDCQCIGMPPIPRPNIKKKSKVKSLVLPTGMVLPIPMGPPVLIGGPPTISLMAMAFKVGFSVAAKGLGKAMGAVKNKGGLARRAKAVTRGKGPPGHGHANKVHPGGSGKAIAGHGVLHRGAGTFEIPKGTTLVVPKDGKKISDTAGRVLETIDPDRLARTRPGTPARKRVIREQLDALGIKNKRMRNRATRDLQDARVLNAGDTVENYTIKTPDKLDIHEASKTVEHSTPLSELVKPDSGTQVVATCTEYSSSFF